MVAGKVKMVMGLQKPPTHSKPEKPPPPPKPPSSGGKTTAKTTMFNRSFGVYFPRASAQVQPRPPDVSDLLKLVEELRDRESKLKTELLEQKLRRESAAIVPLLEADIFAKDEEIERLSNKVLEVEEENEKLVHEMELMKEKVEMERREREAKIAQLQFEVEQLSSNHRLQGLIEVSGKSNLIKSFLSSRKPAKQLAEPPVDTPAERPTTSRCRSSSDETPGTSDSASLSAIVVRSQAPRVPKPPPTKSTSSDSVFASSPVKSTPSLRQKVPPPPPPPPPPKGMKAATAKVKRVPEVVEFYHSLMRRDSRREAGSSTAEITAANTRDLVGEIANRSAYLLAIKTDVETQGDFIRFLIKEVETAAFADIEDVVSFVKWLDDELSYLVDETAVLKHFNWPEQKADALREAAFEYCDFKKLESEALAFRDDARQPCALALKKMQALLEKLEHGAYNLSRLRESATNRFKSFHIPVNWMLDTGFVSQIKLASVKLAMKYMKRVSAELEAVGGGPEEEELIVQGVRFAFRVHQFAGGFDVETMRAFEELRDKARSGHLQFQNQHQHQ
uniref:Protein CHUP1, chloroplastic n=1 Tax=Opuntia streptacantha TaxID=393608 RepID=A0A7C9FA61_OPUST